MNTSWLIYLNLEKELLSSFEYVYFDDSIEQQSVYSNKFAEITLRASIEVETIAKEVYKNSGGDKQIDQRLRFDKDCIKYLNEKFGLNEKVVRITYPFFDCHSDDNNEIFPFSDFNMNNDEGWQKSYQAIKHNRNEEYKKGNLRNALNTVAALYLLCIYYKNETFLIKHSEAFDFDTRFGSSLFSIDKPSNKTGIVGNAYVSEKSVYDYKLTTESKKEYIHQEKEFFERFNSYLDSIPEKKEPEFVKQISFDKYITSYQMVTSILDKLAVYRIEKIFFGLNNEQKIIKLQKILGKNEIINAENYNKKFTDFQLSKIFELQSQFHPSFIEYGFYEAIVLVEISKKH